MCSLIICKLLLNGIKLGRKIMTSEILYGNFSTHRIKIFAQYLFCIFTIMPIHIFLESTERKKSNSRLFFLHCLANGCYYKILDQDIFWCLYCEENTVGNILGLQSHTRVFLQPLCGHFGFH